MKRNNNQITRHEEMPLDVVAKALPDDYDPTMDDEAPVLSADVLPEIVDENDVLPDEPCCGSL